MDEQPPKARAAYGGSASLCLRVRSATSSARLALSCSPLSSRLLFSRRSRASKYDCRFEHAVKETHAKADFDARKVCCFSFPASNLVVSRITAFSNWHHPCLLARPPASCLYSDTAQRCRDREGAEREGPKIGNELDGLTGYRTH
eukprot:842200-Pleurochrysis_carterae.AAC.2